jgi:hypothetical protein
MKATFTPHRDQRCAPDSVGTRARYPETTNFRDKPASIAQTRWAAYATAGVATALAGSQSVEAAIHYSGILNKSFPPRKWAFGTFPLDQPGDSLFFGHGNSICERALFSINGVVSLLSGGLLVS